MWRMRRSVRKRLLFIGLCIVVQVILFCVCQVSVKQIIVKKYEMLLEEKEVVLATAERTVYITKAEVKAGETFTEDNTERRRLLCEQNPEALATEVFGMTACADLSEGVIINTALCCEVEYAKTERECIFSNIGFTEAFPDNAVVDVRIRYANGENYCVLRKKRLQKDGDAEKICGFSLTEEEQLFMSAAQYDVDVYEGAELYLVGFMEERLQEDAISEYVPSVQVLSQLREWNEKYSKSFSVRCELRTELEKRLSEYRQLRADGVL